MQAMTLLVKSEDGQKQAVSALESHLGRSSQVLMHLGTTVGHSDGGRGGEDGALVGWMIVLVEVRVTVETVV